VLSKKGHLVAFCLEVFRAMRPPFAEVSADIQHEMQRIQKSPEELAEYVGLDELDIPAISKSESESWFRWMRSDCRTKRLPRARPVAPVAPAGIAPHRFVLHRSRCDLLGEEL
jgi:hypothetical protein